MLLNNQWITEETKNNKWITEETKNNQWITEETKEEIKKYLEANDNEKRTFQNLWDTAKAVLRRKYTAIQSYLRKQEKSQINNLTLHLKQVEKRRTNKTQSE